jgi:hypothetical protein
VKLREMDLDNLKNQIIAKESNYPTLIKSSVLTESRLSLGLVINVEYDVVTDVEFEQVDHELDLELAVNGKLISILN